MKEFRGTPGPWKAEGDEFYGWCVASEDVVVADLDFSDQEWDVQAANARLMASSKDLLEALQYALPSLGFEEADKARAAIRKALGE